MLFTDKEKACVAELVEEELDIVKARVAKMLNATATFNDEHQLQIRRLEVLSRILVKLRRKNR